MTTYSFDIAVIGSGFAGSLMAMIGRRLGRSVVLLERGKHPRFVIGESTTPITNLLLEEIAQTYDLPRLKPLTKWGSWQRSYPDVACGLKRGFTFFHHRWNHRFVPEENPRNELRVAASPRNEIGDTHWYRPDFDHFLAMEAANLGAEYLDEIHLQSITWMGGAPILGAVRYGRSLSIKARLVVDATGPRGFLHQALSLPEAAFAGFPPTQALYTHFTQVRRLGDLESFQGTQPSIYPVDDSAVHHLFSGGWIWVLRFNNGRTSAGVAASRTLGVELKFSEGASAWNRLLEHLPSVQEQFDSATPCFPFVYSERLPFRTSSAAGPDWVLLPSAAGFVDPLLSTGFPLTLLGILRVARVLERSWGRERFAPQLESYGRLTLEELDYAALLVEALYANLHRWETFTALSMVYFTAATFSESARRLGRPQLADSFLLCRHPQFGSAVKRLCNDAIRGAKDHHFGVDSQWLTQVQEVMAPFDIGGFASRDGRNYYPASYPDLNAAAAKLGVSREEIQTMLKRSGFLIS